MKLYHTRYTKQLEQARKELKMDDFMNRESPLNYKGCSLVWNEETGIVSILQKKEFMKQTMKYSEKENAIAEAKRIVDFLE
jgi:hypothetical protein